MTPTVMTRPPARNLFDRLRASRLAAASAAIVVAAGTLAAVNSVVFDDPVFVEAIAFDNGSDYDIQVAVSSNGLDMMPIGVALQHCETTIELVIDQGATWHLRFRAQGRDGGEVVVDRPELEAAGWTYRIPDSVAEHLRGSGAPVPPQQSCRTRS